LNRGHGSNFRARGMVTISANGDSFQYTDPTEIANVLSGLMKLYGDSDENNETTVDDYSAKLGEISNAIDADANKAWSDSFVTKKNGNVKTRENGFVIVQDENGSISAANKTTSQFSGRMKGQSYALPAGVKLVGDFHTHPYSDGTIGVAFSGNDIKFILDKVPENSQDGFIRMVEAGDQRFALVISDLAKAKNFLQKSPITQRWQYAFDNAQGSYQSRVIEAVKYCLGNGEETGIQFYGTTNTSKNEFKKID